MLFPPITWGLFDGNIQHCMYVSDSVNSCKNSCFITHFKINNIKRIFGSWCDRTEGIGHAFELICSKKIDNVLSGLKYFFDLDRDGNNNVLVCAFLWK